MTPADPRGPRRHVALDSLRGLAALLVVLLHLEGSGPILSSPFVRNGWLAVDFFFVLSGFVIAAAYARPLADGFSTTRFMILRLGRIYPVHAAVLVALLAYELALSAGVQAIGVERAGFADVRQSWEWLWKTALLIQAWYPDAPPAWNAQSWSISVELWLYLSLALVMRLAGMRGVACAIAAGLIALGVLASGFDDYFVPLSREMMRGVAGFGLGVGTWRLHEALRAPIARLPPLSLSLAEVLAVACVFLAISSFARPWHFFPLVLSFAALVLVFAEDRGRLSRVLAARPFVALGVVSYSLYMVQYPIIRRRDLVAELFGFETVPADAPNRPDMIVADPWIADLFGLLMVGFAVAVAAICWWLVEDPARRWSRKKAEAWGQGKREGIAPTF